MDHDFGLGPFGFVVVGVVVDFVDDLLAGDAGVVGDVLDCVEVGGGCGMGWKGAVLFLVGVSFAAEVFFVELGGDVVPVEIGTLPVLGFPGEVLQVGYLSHE